MCRGQALCIILGEDFFNYYLNIILLILLLLYITINLLPGKVVTRPIKCKVAANRYIFHIPKVFTYIQYPVSLF